MNIIIDVGNTNLKFAVFEHITLIEKIVIGHQKALDTFQYLKQKYPNISKGIISSVGNIDEAFMAYIQDKVKLLTLNSKTKLPFKNLYKTPHTLGVDRIGLVAAAINKYPKKNVLVIDTGTCITYDFIDDKNNYLGGAISPGIKVRYQALHNLTANLPLLHFKPPKNIIGNSTETSIHSGVVNGVITEIEGFVKKYEKNHKDLTVILTGGDSDFLSKQFKNGIFANSNLLLEGLNHILEFNIA